MESLLARVTYADDHTITVCREARVSPADYNRNASRWPRPYETHPDYVVVRREITQYGWDELERAARDETDREEQRILTTLLTQARRRVPNRRPLTMLLDSEGMRRAATLSHVTRAPLGPAKQWETIASVRIDRATDGSWIALVDVRGTTDFGITHECPDVTALMGKLGQSLEWALRRKHEHSPRPQQASAPAPRAVSASVLAVIAPPPDVVQRKKPRTKRVDLRACCASCRKESGVRKDGEMRTHKCIKRKCTGCGLHTLSSIAFDDQPCPWNRMCAGILRPTEQGS